MRLVEWRREKELTQAGLAELLECDQSYVSLIERGEPDRIPGRKMMVLIYKITNGAVQPNDFYDLPTLNQGVLPLPYPPGPEDSDPTEPELQLDQAA